MDRIDGRVAWVVGATGAIGSAVTSTLSGLGATVWASGRNEARLAELVDAAERSDQRLNALPLDGRDDASVRRAVERIVASGGRIDILVNSTAVGVAKDFLSLTDDDWSAVLDSKLLTYVRTMRAALPSMLAAGGGCIVNISGRGGRQPSAAHLAGGSANAAVTLLTKGIAETYRTSGIRANTILPGPIRSERADVIARGNRGLAAQTFGWDRVGEPQDVAHAVAWLVGDGARHINGTTIAVDGGGTATV
jgi:3-oxoacyl-[acyl-carrier protein] reductase